MPGWEGSPGFPCLAPEGWEPSLPEGCSTAFLFVPNTAKQQLGLFHANVASHLHCLEQKEHTWYLPPDVVFWTLSWMLGRTRVYFAFSCLGLIKASPLCSHSGCSSLRGWPALVNPRGSGQTPLYWGPQPLWVGGLQPPARLPSPGSAHPTPSSGWAESCLPANTALDPDMLASFQGLDPKLWGLLFILKTPHTITCPGLYRGFVLGALREPSELPLAHEQGSERSCCMAGLIHPSMPVNSA